MEQYCTIKLYNVYDRDKLRDERSMKWMKHRYLYYIITLFWTCLAMSFLQLAASTLEYIFFDPLEIVHFSGGPNYSQHAGK